MQRNNKYEHRNPYPEFDPKNGHGILKESKTLDDGLLGKIKQAVSQYTDAVNRATVHMQDYSVYTGIAGISLLNFLLSQRLNNSGALQKAYDLLKKAPLKIHQSRATFLQDTGPVAISAVLSHYLGRAEESTKSVHNLMSVLNAVISSDSDIPDEFLYGRAGYLYSLLFVKKHIGPQSIDTSTIKQVVTSILKSGIARSKAYRSPVPLVFEWYGDNYYGAAHGVVGILYILLKTGVLTAEEKEKLVKPTLNTLLAQRLPSGNFPAVEGDKSDRLVQWCHGAPGFAELLASAYEELGEEHYYNVLLECGEVVWQRGLTTKGYSICHGVSGNAYIFLQLYQLTGDVKHLYRAGCFADWCLTLPKHQQLQPDTPYSLFEGLAGVAYFLADIQQPSKAGFPAYTLQL